MITIPWFPKELKANIRKQHRYSTGIRTKYKQDCFLATKASKVKINDTIASLDIVFYPPNNRHDLDNCLASIKYGIDGIAEALEVNDKNFRPIKIDFGKADKLNPRVEITITNTDKGEIK